ncbi:hypothetical protein Kpho02_32060 [Kitasatospora phosalacinea]|uniref:Uncharacterized protein n=1 Tax=Kitasatospora phosalacinea TaxID=2065 RepID=A0A9W6V351_9ACTN|nr:hypothetical protein Kpho02_32060 [Kitasatospora phosalacinea]
MCPMCPHPTFPLFPIAPAGLPRGESHPPTLPWIIRRISPRVSGNGYSRVTGALPQVWNRTPRA